MLVQPVVHCCFFFFFVVRAPPHAKGNDAFNKWHIAFHGTASENVRKILKTGHLVLPGQSGTVINFICLAGYILYIICVYVGDLIAGGTKVRQPEGHFTKDRKPAGFDVDQIFVSPSIKYSGCDSYAIPTR